VPTTQYPTIQAAVNAAGTNVAIHVAPGVYTGQVVVVRKKLSLIGARGVVMSPHAGAKISGMRRSRHQIAAFPYSCELPKRDSLNSVAA
jgi:pectin methylesterase-like acyl-CoA thioesterase